MVMAEKNKPDVITLTPDEAEALRDRIIRSTLAEHDQKTVLSLLSFNFWLQNQLERSKLTILRLRKIFCLSTEKIPK